MPEATNQLVARIDVEVSSSPLVCNLVGFQNVVAEAMSPSPYGECLVVNPTTITKALTLSSSLESPSSPDSWPQIFLSAATDRKENVGGKDDQTSRMTAAAPTMTEEKKTSSASPSSSCDPECDRSDKNNKLADIGDTKALTLSRQKEKQGADRRRCTSLDGEVVQVDEAAAVRRSTHRCHQNVKKRVEEVQQEQHGKSEELRSVSAKPTAGGKKPLLRPKDILMSSRQKSHILAHKSKTASSGAVPSDVLTHDLLVTVAASTSISTSSSATSCRDDKKVEDITKALDQLSMSAAKQMLLTTGRAAGDGERIQRSPIPVSFEHHRRVNPYSAAVQAQRFGRPVAGPQDSTTPAWNWHRQGEQPICGGGGNGCRVGEEALPDTNCAVFVYGTPPEYCGDTEQHHQQLSPCAYQQSQGHLVTTTAGWPNHDVFTYHARNVATVPAEAQHSQGRNSGGGSTTSSSPLAPINELPDELSDYILQYSNKAAAASDDHDHDGAAANKGNNTTAGEYGIDLNAAILYDDNSGVGNVPNEAAPTCTTGTDLQAPMRSPPSPSLRAAVPILKSSENVMATDALKSKLSKFNSATTTTSCAESVSPTTTGTGVVKTAKEQLRDMIGNDDFNQAWIWALKCSQTFPGALYYRDVDGDSFLHIVVWHKDLAKIYSLTELMNRDDTHSFPKPFDLKNKQNETPLFLAVEKRLKEVVAYGMENSENPNTQTFNRDGDTPLHYAASRGMTEIVEILCQSPLIDLNMYNGAGLTPLLCAVKNHKNAVEGNQELLNNKPAVRALLLAGADPKIIDFKTGKTIFHYAVECMDPLLIRIFRDHMDKETMQTLVNQPSLVGETPLRLLCRVAGARGLEAESPVVGEQLRAKMCQTLIESGAEWPRTTVGTGGADSPDFLLDDNGFTYFP